MSRVMAIYSVVLWVITIAACVVFVITEDGGIATAAIGTAVGAGMNAIAFTSMVVLLWTDDRRR